ncbi:uncharacterized protein LOC144863679 [Branchiostoma floridae x Branchiostoma japonicum]
MSSSTNQQDVPGTVDTDRDTMDGEGEVAFACGTVNSEAETVDIEAQPDNTVDAPTHLLFHITSESSDTKRILKFLPRGSIKKNSREHISIGRRETSDLRLHHAQASRDLMRITPTVNSSNLSFTITNVGSKGFSVNNMVLCKGAETPLTSGSVIALDFLNLQMTADIKPGDDEKMYEVQFHHVNQVAQAATNDHDRLTSSRKQQPSSNCTDLNVPVCKEVCTSSDFTDQNEHLCGKHVQPPPPQQPPVECPHGQCTSQSKPVEKQASAEPTVQELLTQLSSGNGSAPQVVFLARDIVVNMGGQGLDTRPQGPKNTTDTTRNGEVTAMQESGQGGSEEGSPVQVTEDGESSNLPVMCTDTQNEECSKSPMTDIQGSGGLQPTSPVESDDRDSRHADDERQGVNPGGTVAETVDTPTRLTLLVHNPYPGLKLHYPSTTITKTAKQPFLIAAARNEKADIQIDDQRVSRDHMQIEFLTTKAGHFGFQLRKVKKNKIVNVDGQSVDAEVPVQLKSGNSICLKLPGSPVVNVEFSVKVETGDAPDVYEVMVKKK